MVAEMGAEQTSTSGLAEIYERSAPAGFRLATRGVTSSP